MERSYLHLPTRLALIKPDSGIPYIRKQHINDTNEADDKKGATDKSKGMVILLLKPRR